jgi:hypothetical protein
MVVGRVGFLKICLLLILRKADTSLAGLIEKGKYIAVGRGLRHGFNLSFETSAFSHQCVVNFQLFVPIGHDRLVWIQTATTA